MQGHKSKVNWRCMELTELEFEDLLSFAMKDESEVPLKTNDKLKKKINAKLRYKRIMKAVPASAACVVIGVVLTSVMLNDGGNNVNDVVHKPIAANEKIITTDLSERNIARGTVEESKTINNTLIECLDNDIEKMMTVTARVKEYMQNNPQYAFYDDFKGLSGNESCLNEESGELVVIFDAGTVAPKEHGEIFINVGIIK